MSNNLLGGKGKKNRLHRNYIVSNMSFILEKAFYGEKFQSQ